MANPMKPRAAKDRLIVALDVAKQDDAWQIMRELGNQVGAYKIGMELYNAEGPAIIGHLQQLATQPPYDIDLKVFLDLKLHDIPNTVAGAARAIANHGAFMINVHASGGSQMMRAAAEALREEEARRRQPRPLLIGVTVLTSMSEAEMQEELAVARSVGDQVSALAKLAQAAGLDGVVCSPREIALVREVCGPDFLIVTPGIRPRDAAANDQKRVMTPAEAIGAGADYLVIGRPITKPAQGTRLAAVENIIREMEESLNEQR